MGLITSLGRKCLVLDLDETLVHSSFHEVDRYDFKLTIEIEKRKHTLYVAKRPYVDEFLKTMSQTYEAPPPPSPHPPLIGQF